MNPMMTLAQAQGMLPGSQVVGDRGLAFARVHTDTRTLQAGDLFVALKGERFDAHDFLDAARVSGAVAALASRGIAEAGLSGLQVDDPLAALQALATAFRDPPTEPLLLDYLASPAVRALLHDTWKRDYTPFADRGRNWLLAAVDGLVALRLLVIVIVPRRDEDREDAADDDDHGRRAMARQP